MSTITKSDIIKLVGGIFIMGFAIWGAAIFMENYDPLKGINNFFSFIPSGVACIALWVYGIIEGGNLATSMMILLIFTGFVLLILGFTSKEENSKNALLGGASGLLGLGLGVPFGEALRRAEDSHRRTVDINKTKKN